MKSLFFIEVTDVFGGEANYSWVTRHVVEAKSLLGAVQWLSRQTGLHWRCSGQVGCDSRSYDSASGSTRAFIESWDEDCHAGLTLDTWPKSWNIKEAVHE